MNRRYYSVDFRGDDDDFALEKLLRAGFVGGEPITLSLSYYKCKILTFIIVVVHFFFLFHPETFVQRTHALTLVNPHTRKPRNTLYEYKNDFTFLFVCFFYFFIAVVSVLEFVPSDKRLIIIFFV